MNIDQRDPLLTPFFMLFIYGTIHPNSTGNCRKLHLIFPYNWTNMIYFSEYSVVLLSSNTTLHLIFLSDWRIAVTIDSHNFNLYSVNACPRDQPFPYHIISSPHQWFDHILNYVDDYTLPSSIINPQIPNNSLWPHLQVNVHFLIPGPTNV